MIIHIIIPAGCKKCLPAKNLATAKQANRRLKLINKPHAAARENTSFYQMLKNCLTPLFTAMNKQLREMRRRLS